MCNVFLLRNIYVHSIGFPESFRAFDKRFIWKYWQTCNRKKRGREECIKVFQRLFWTYLLLVLKRQGNQLSYEPRYHHLWSVTEMVSYSFLLGNWYSWFRPLSLSVPSPGKPLVTSYLHIMCFHTVMDLSLHKVLTTATIYIICVLFCFTSVAQHPENLEWIVEWMNEWAAREKVSRPLKI